MSTIYRSDRGQLIEASDAYGTFYYLADAFGAPCQGGWTDRDTAIASWETLEASEDEYPEADVMLDDRGRRVAACAYCHCDVSIDDVPDVDDESAWAEAAGQHADDCEWLLTRAHRVEPLEYQVRKAARADAALFVDEFHEVIDPTTTDWDAVAWSDTRESLPLTQDEAERLWPIYQAELVAETERLVSGQS